MNEWAPGDTRPAKWQLWDTTMRYVAICISVRKVNFRYQALQTYETQKSICFRKKQ